KGSDAYQQNVGDPLHRPNPCIGAIEQPPFYAMAVYASDIGTSAGLVTNELGQVLRENASPIPGLYACGSDMASIMAGPPPPPRINNGPRGAFCVLAPRPPAARPGKLGGGS